MKQALRLLALVAVASVAAVLLVRAPGAGRARAAAKPNFILVIADDLDAGSPDLMPRLQAHVAGQGVTFSNNFTSTPICCPSRVSMLTGQYAHNHGIQNNGRAFRTCADVARDQGLERSTLATWLKDAGYRTALVGKYLNRYPGGAPNADSSYVPPGWSEFHAVFSEQGSDAYYDYSVNQNGTVVRYGAKDADYMTDVLMEEAVAFIKKAAAQAEPFFLVVAPSAPHRPALPARRHQYAYADRRAPRTPSFNEADVGDKPSWLPRLFPSPLTSEEIGDLDGLYRGRLETLLSVDEGIEAMLLALLAAGQLDNTYLFFTSDNGFMLGQHRFPGGKDAPYEPSIRIPLMVRGPGVPAASVVTHDSLNIDYAPTILELAGARVPDSVDGRSLSGFLRGAPPAAWRQDVLVEEETQGDGIPSWAGLRTKDWIYVEYPSQAEFEYYDFVNDPYQLNNRHAGLDGERRRQLSARLTQLQTCRGASCRN